MQKNLNDIQGTDNPTPTTQELQFLALAEVLDVCSGVQVSGAPPSTQPWHAAQQALSRVRCACAETPWCRASTHTLCSPAKPPFTGLLLPAGATLAAEGAGISYLNNGQPTFSAQFVVQYAVHFACVRVSVTCAAPA